MMNLRLSRMLADAGNTVDVITYPFGSAPDYSGVSVHRCPGLPFVKRVGIGFSPAKLLMDMRLASFAMKISKQYKYDVIHAVEEAIFIGVMMGRRTGTPVIYDMDSVLSHDVGSSVLGKLRPAMAFVRSAERWAIRNSDLVLTITPAMADHVKSIDPTKKIAVVPDIPQPLPEGGLKPEYAREQLPIGFAEEKQIIIYTGSTAEYQGLDLLISAMPQVNARYRSTVLLVVGGEDSDIHRLQQQALQLGVHNLAFLGKRPPEDIPHFLDMADVLVSPRRNGVNPPAKLYTYMQSGKPIVATNIPAHTAILNNSTAILTPTTVDGFAEGIIHALTHPCESTQMAARACEIVSDMTPEKQTRSILDAYRMVCRA